MANDQESRGHPEDLGQDPYVERRRPDPSEPPKQVRVLEGLLGDSDREGYKRLYFTRELDNYAEFRTEDVVFREPIPSEQPPMVGLDTTRVGIRRDGHRVHAGEGAPSCGRVRPRRSARGPNNSCTREAYWGRLPDPAVLYK